MLNKKVIHKTFGEGEIIAFENNIVTVRFAEKTSDFRYPDIFAQFLTFADEQAQSEAKALADEAIADKEARRREKAAAKADEQRRLYESWAKNNKRPLSKAEQRIAAESNLAFKLNFNNGGCSAHCIGYKGVCSEEQICYNIETKNRTWCSNPDSPCGRFHRGEITYADLLALHDESFVCYESCTLTAWTCWAGDDLEEDGGHKARRINNVKKNGLAVLTTEFPKTDERVIFGAFITAAVAEGNEIDSGYVKADPEYTIELTPSEARKMPFWNYYKNTDGSQKWGSGLYRYLTNTSCVNILKDIVEIKPENDKAQAKKVLARYLELKGISDN